MPWDDWVAEQARKTKDAVTSTASDAYHGAKDVYHKSEKWVKKNADEIDLFTDFIPVVGQVKDAYYTIKFGWQVYQNPSNDNLLEFGFTLIGWVPYAGDVLKGAFKVARKNPDKLLTAARKAMSMMGKHGDPEKFLYDLVSVGSLNTRVDYVYHLIDNALIGKWGADMMRRQLSNMIHKIKSLLNRVADAMKRFLDKYLPHTPKSSVSIPATVKTPKKVTTKAKAKPQPKKQVAEVTHPNSRAKTTSKGANKDDNGSGNTHNRKIDTNLKSTLIGIIGEHMGDYWVAKELGYTVAHDAGESYPSFKLDGPMTMLNGKARGTGLDSLWKTDHKPLGKQPTNQLAKTLYAFDREHAIVEYKASGTKDDKSLASVLTKNKGRKKPKKTNQSGSIKSRKREDENSDKDDENYQMSKPWGNDKLKQKGWSDSIGKYSRHVLYFGVTAIAEHSLALSKDKQNPNEAEHRNHHATWIADGTAIDKAIDDKKQRKNKRGKK